MSEPKSQLKNWTMQVLDREQVNREKGWEQNVDLSPEDRVRLIEHLRMMWHGADAINARVLRVFEVTSRS